MKKFFLFIILILTFSCKPFNSNEYNKELIQGRWLQVTIESVTEDAKLHIDHTKDLNTLLIFKGDSCTENINHLQETRNYLIAIKDYFIKLQQQGASDSYLRINKLTDDSLILQTEDSRILRYIKTTAEAETVD